MSIKKSSIGESFDTGEPRPSVIGMSKVFKWMRRVKQKIAGRHNLIIDDVRVTEHKFEFKEMSEIILTSLDSKTLFIKDGRAENVEEDDFRMTYDELCNCLLIVGHLLFQKLILYSDFTLKEALDDFIYQILTRFTINAQPLYRKRLEKMLKFATDLNHENSNASSKKDDQQNASNGLQKSNGTLGQVLKKLKEAKLKKE